MDVVGVGVVLQIRDSCAAAACFLHAASPPLSLSLPLNPPSGFRGAGFSSRESKFSAVGIVVSFARQSKRFGERNPKKKTR
ncbi:hypothetical protein NHX12_003003 [Muraenolepis orangiensis]|uniref:Uncharacterized protein n=1 Tax=Muraenolepis orangiensis TaxID=630683 RepID=A0A9Q0DZW6_9TELE|nr:hypothetical protein NHX12_003003 [Muraenolepis orangiensis]